MGLHTLANAALSGAFSARGEDAVFTPATGDPIPCKIFISFNVALQPNGVETQVWQQGTTIEAFLVDPTPNGTGVAIGREPNRDETFTLDIPSNDTVYTVQAILENDGLTVKAVVT